MEDEGGNDDVELAEATAFGHRFVDLPGNIEDLITLEKEGAVYSHFWDDAIGTFRYYRVPFLPAEIYQYVEAHVAKQQFDKALADGATFDEALQSISNPEIARRVQSYGNYGRSKLRNGREADLRGCAASFYTPEIEALVCGQRRDRYQLLPDMKDVDKSALLLQMIDYFPTLARFMARRGNDRPPFLIQNEYGVQHLLFVAVRSVFDDARLEEWTSKHAGKSKRVDLVVPSAQTLIETKNC